MKNSIVKLLFLGSLVFMSGILLPVSSSAGVYSSDSEVTYKEYWVNHNQFTGGCPALAPPQAFVEPSDTCTKTLSFEIPDVPGSATKAEIYLDLLRNRTSLSAQFTLNGNATVYEPDVGSNWSRTPYVGLVNKAELVQGTNTITFTGTSAYNVHDVAIRLYYTDASPLTGPGDVTAPDGALSSVGGVDPAVGGVLDVSANSLVLSATATDASYVEFHGYYYGYDEDNDKEFIDWHNVKRLNNNPGGDGTIDHLGTDSISPYSVTWSLPHVPNQSGVRFKIRVVDAAGNVREAAGGASAEFVLSRSQLVESYLVPVFSDFVLHRDGFQPDLVTRNVALPDDLSDVTAAYLVGAFSQDPSIADTSASISINGKASFPVFDLLAGEDVWELSVRSIPLADLRPGVNAIDYLYSGTGYGEFIEQPGPMVVLQRARSPAPAAAFVADGFSAPELNKDVWSFIDPVGDAVMSMSGTQVMLSVPLNESHNMTAIDDRAARILQPAANTDFELEVKFDSAVTLDTQLQGILIQEDANEFLRFGLFSEDGINTKMLSAKYVDGIQINVGRTIIAAAGVSPLYMRVKREGDTWTQSYSLDGLTYTPAAPFTHPMMVRDVGLYAGNANAVPAHTGSFDYFTTTSAAIASGPVDQAVIVGDTATFSVEGLGTSALPISYQWQKDGVALGGATGASYTTPATILADDGSTYQVVVSNALGNVTSSAATLTVTPAPVAPVITTQPADRTVTEGKTATFSVFASGTAPLSYQWQKNGADIPGAISTSYTTSATTLADDGTTYRVVVTNLASSVTSNAATLTVTAAPVAPTITTQPADQSVDAGEIATFSVVASGTAPLSYQWQKNGVNIPGETSASYTTAATTLADDGTTYRVVVGNAAASVISGVATLTVTPVAPTIITQPADQSVTEGQTATFSVVAGGTAPLDYQWQKNGVAIVGATSASYVTPVTSAADDGASYRVVVSNAAGDVTSGAAVLTVNPASSSSRSGGGGGGGGCVLNVATTADPLLPLLLLVALGYLFGRRFVRPGRF